MMMMMNQCQKRIFFFQIFHDYNEFFQEKYMGDYNRLICYAENVLNITFTICPENIVNTVEVIHLTKESDRQYFRHPYLTKCYYSKSAYCCCITYRDEDKHICNAFPVMLGSSLDQAFLLTAAAAAAAADDDNEDDDYSPKYYDNCSGYFMIGGRFCWLPYLLSNNRELLHLINEKTIGKRSHVLAAAAATAKRPKCCTVQQREYERRRQTETKNAKCFIKYYYTDNGKGHLIKYKRNPDNSVQITHRDATGKEHVDDVSEIKRLVQDSPLGRRHIVWNTGIMKKTFCHLINFLRPIDDLSNKLILSPSILLERLLYATRNNSRAITIIYNGLWNRLISMTSENTNSISNDAAAAARQRTIQHGPTNCAIIKDETKKRKRIQTVTTYEESNIYRKPAGHQMGRRELFAQVIRINSQKNTGVNIIPENYIGYLCLLEKGTSIDSFNKQYSLIADVEISSKFVAQERGYLDLPTLLDQCLARGLFIRKFSTNIEMIKYNLKKHEHYVFINGGFITPYLCLLRNTADFSSFFYQLKAMNTYVEICKFPHCILLNMIIGVPMKRLSEKLLVSSFEFSHFRSLLLSSSTSLSNIAIFGPQCHERNVKYLKYSKMNKVLHGINYMKSRIATTTTNAQMRRHSLFLFGLETVSLFIIKNNDDDNNNTTNEFTKYNMLFAAEPFCTQDGYLLHNNNSREKFLFLRRYQIELEYSNDMIVTVAASLRDIVWKKNNQQWILLCTIKNNLKKMKIVKNQKLRMYTIDNGNENYTHHVYFFTNFYCILDAVEKKLTLHSFVYRQHLQSNSSNANQWYLVIELILQHINTNYYDGFKLCNPESQKGLCNTRLNLRQRYGGCGGGGGKVDLIGSAFSILGRNAIGQMKKMNRDRQLTESVSSSSTTSLVAPSEMCVLRNIASDHRNTSLMRLDNLMINMLQLNNCNMSLFTLLQTTTFDDDEKHEFLPKPNKDLLRLLLTCKKNIQFKNFSGQQTHLL
nr:hypothetical protein [Microctonus hyperodae filamentous virus]